MPSPAKFKVPVPPISREMVKALPAPFVVRVEVASTRFKAKSGMLRLAPVIEPRPVLSTLSVPPFMTRYAVALAEPTPQPAFTFNVPPLRLYVP